MCPLRWNPPNECGSIMLHLGTLRYGFDLRFFMFSLGFLSSSSLVCF